MRACGKWLDLQDLLPEIPQHESRREKPLMRDGKKSTMSKISLVSSVIPGIHFMEK